MGMGRNGNSKSRSAHVYYEDVDVWRSVATRCTDFVRLFLDLERPEVNEQNEWNYELCGTLTAATLEGDERAERVELRAVRHAHSGDTGGRRTSRASGTTSCAATTRCRRSLNAGSTRRRPISSSSSTPTINRPTTPASAASSTSSTPVNTHTHTHTHTHVHTVDSHLCRRPPAFVQKITRNDIYWVK